MMNSLVDEAQARGEFAHLRAWLARAQRKVVQKDPNAAPWLATLSPPRERALAQTMGWPLVDGLLPWAQAAAKNRGDHEGDWAFITLCNWHVSNGQVTMSDPAHLQIDDATDAQLFNAMQPFFAEDGITLQRYKPGQWLAQSPVFANLPTASVDRVIGRNIDPWLVGGDNLLRRLQNEMQMLLYTHPVNDARAMAMAMAINSFWVHGTGSLTESLSASSNDHVDVRVVNSLRSSALNQDFLGWLDAWKEVDSQVMSQATLQPISRLVLCGEHEFHVYESAAPTLYQRLRARFAPVALHNVLLKDLD
jgi:hypothetical protein